MPRSCSICGHAELAAITKALAQGVSYRDISSRFGVTAASAQRHTARCLRLVRRPEKSGASEERMNVADSSRFDSEGRCQKCGTLLDDPSPPALVKRAERLLWLAETIAAKAQKDDDARLALQAVDRARGSLDQLLKVHGLLQPDGATTINVDARTQGLAVAARIPEWFLRKLAAGDPAAIGELESAIEIGENETPIRDAGSVLAS
jgi:hypothetical protein